MEIESRLSHLIAKYKRTLEKDPSSRVFAPLAECYRKAGLMADALVTLRDGLSYHPDSVLGHIGLAQCYSDQSQNEKVYETLKPLKDSNLDNIKLLRLYAQSCLKLNKNEEALEVYKYILFLSPTNKEAIDVVTSLEDSVYTSSESAGTNAQQAEHFPIDKLENKDTPEKTIDDWEAVDFSESPSPKMPMESGEDKEVEIENSWSMESVPKETIGHEDEDIQVEDIDEDKEDEERSFKVLTSEKFTRPKSVENPDEAESSKPLITHTLVDLYCAQGHYGQAYHLLKKILELNPDDERTVVKMKEVQEFMDFEDSALERTQVDKSEGELDEEEAHAHLASLVESKVQVSKRGRQNEVEAKLWMFHEKLVERSKMLK